MFESIVLDFFKTGPGVDIDFDVDIDVGVDFDFGVDDDNVGIVGSFFAGINEFENKLGKRDGSAMAEAKRAVGLTDSIGFKNGNFVLF